MRIDSSTDASTLERLSLAWRILGHLGLLDTIFNHISYSWSDKSGARHLVMNPVGLLPEEVLPHTLRTVALRAYPPEEAAETGINADGLRLHAFLHMARNKPAVVVHTHSIHALAVGATSQGLLPISQTAMELLPELHYVGYCGPVRSGEFDGILEEFARSGGVALLRNHGSLVIADCPEEAVYLAYYLEEAARIQILTLSQSNETILPSSEVVRDSGAILKSDRKKESRRLFEAFARSLDRDGNRGARR